jgi:hypothetical protein
MSNKPDCSDCPLPEKVHQLSKDLAVTEERVNSAFSMLKEFCNKTDEIKDLATKYGVELLYISENLKSIQGITLPKISEEVSDLKLKSAKSGAIWGALTGFIITILAAGAIALIKSVV